MSLWAFAARWGCRSGWRPLHLARESMVGVSSLTAAAFYPTLPLRTHYCQCWWWSELPAFVCWWLDAGRGVRQLPTTFVLYCLLFLR